MIRIRFLLTLVAAGVLAAAAASVASASHSWGNYHWARTANPFTLKVGDNVTSTWDSYLDTAVTDWTQSAVMNLVEVPGQAKGGNCRPTSGRIEVCNKRYGSTGWLGVAQIWLSGGSHIAQATAKMNDTYHDIAPYSSPEWRGHVLCQEVGHDFGLDHQDESGADLHTCMDYVDSPHEHSAHPNQHDYDQLVTIYGGHLDATTTISAGLAGSNDAQPERVERSDRISASTVTEHFADGSRRVTHTYWAVPRGRRSI